MVGHVFILDNQESFFAVSFIRVGTEVGVMVAGAEKVLSFFFFFLIIILEQSWKNQGTREVDLEGTAPKAFGPVASVGYF